MHAQGSIRPLRIDYLSYDPIAGQWRYVSIEARIPVAPMSAASFERDSPDHISLRFDPFAAPPIAPGWSGGCSVWRKSSLKMVPTTRQRINTLFLRTVLQHVGSRIDTTIDAINKDDKILSLTWYSLVVEHRQRRPA